MKPLDMNMNLIGSGGSNSRHKRVHKEVPRANSYDEEKDRLDLLESDLEDLGATTDKNPQRQPWTEIPQNQWNENEPAVETDANKDAAFNQDEPLEVKPDSEKPSNLQALVDAIGSRMRDIENVVQRMSEKVHQPGETDKGEVVEDTSHKRQKPSADTKEYGKTKQPGNDDNYKRFSVRNRGSKYLHVSDATSEQPLFLEDTGYYSDASNSVIRRANSPKEPVQTYMAPVETHRKEPHAPDATDDKKKKKHQHKKKKENIIKA